MSRRWPITALASVIGVGTIAAPTLVAVYLVDRSAVPGRSAQADAASFWPSGSASATPAGDVTTSSPPASPSTSILPPLMPASPAAASLAVRPTPDAHIAGQLVSWSRADDAAAVTVPAVLRDGRRFSVSAVIDAHHVLGIARDSAASVRAGAFAIVVIDPATGNVTTTVDTGENSASQVAEHSDQSDIVGPDAVSGDWVGWIRGHQGDDDAMTGATIFVSNIATGQRRSLGYVASGESSQLIPRLSGDLVAWASPDALHVDSLSQGAPAYTLPLPASSGATFIDDLRAPWLSYETRAAGSTTHHVVDVRTGADRVVSGPCDGAWCEKSQPTALLLTPQTTSGAGRMVASDVNSAVSGFAGMADGFFLWSVDETGSQRIGSYVYDPVGDRDIALPPTQNGVAFVTGHYVVWEDAPADPSTSGPMRFVDLESLR